MPHADVERALELALELTGRYAAVYHRFLVEDLAGRPAIRGQLIGPVGLGFGASALACGRSLAGSRHSLWNMTLGLDKAF